MTMSKEFFGEVGKIAYEGPDSDNPLAFRFYQPDLPILGKPMVEHLRWAVCYWHSFCATGRDVFGEDTLNHGWMGDGDPMEMALAKADAAFEFFDKMGAPFFCFHDRDVAPEGKTLSESNGNLDRVVEYFQSKMDETGVKLLWGTANLFSHPRYAAGAATNPDPEIFTYAAAQVRHALECTHRLGGENYVLWGGREGYDTLLNTDLKQEFSQLGKFLQLVVEHKHSIGFKGTILIEPKPQEPTKHQYDYDAASLYAFLQKFGLEKEVKLNLEVNHATLAGHSFQHELAFACANGLFGSIDVNRGDPQCGWDTDQFPNSHEELTLALYTILQGGGFDTGGANFDAKVRRQSIDPLDLFYGHIGGVDTLARGLLGAAKMIEDGVLQKHLESRYAGWEEGIGKSILNGETSLSQLADLVARDNLDPAPRSGRQEMLENVVNRYL
jgi:xylose isomerase